MLPFVGNEKQDISTVTSVFNYKTTYIQADKYCGACSTHGIDDISCKSFVGQANGVKKFGRPMRTWEVNINP